MPLVLFLEGQSDGAWRGPAWRSGTQSGGVEVPPHRAPHQHPSTRPSCPFPPPQIMGQGAAPPHSCATLHRQAMRLLLPMTHPPPPFEGPSGEPLIPSIPFHPLLSAGHFSPRIDPLPFKNFISPVFGNAGLTSACMGARRAGIQRCTAGCMQGPPSIFAKAERTVT